MNPRYLQSQVEQDVRRKMVFVAGPRQVGKTTLSLGFVMDHYGAKNVHEFFAVTYTDYLRHRYGLPPVKELDEEGVMTAIFRWYDDLAAD